MQIRLAFENDIPALSRLLYQTIDVHAHARPDLFKVGTKKYTDEKLKEIVSDSNTPVFVAEEEGEMLGYAFCVFQKFQSDPVLTNVKTMRIDDICVDERYRRRKIGTQLYRFVLSFAKTLGCYNVTLNVWACNQSALRFYESCGLRVQKIGLETVLN